MVFAQRVAGFGERAEGAGQSRLAGEGGEAGGTDGARGLGTSRGETKSPSSRLFRSLRTLAGVNHREVVEVLDLTSAQHPQVDQQIVQAGLLGVRSQERKVLAVDVYCVGRPFEALHSKLLRRRHQGAESRSMISSGISPPWMKSSTGDSLRLKT